MRPAYDLPPVALAAAIFAVSAIPGRDLPDSGIPHADKVVHAAEYAALAWLIHRALTAPGRSRPGWRSVALAALLAFLYGVGDEVHQLFVPRRTFALGDLAADALGATAAAVVRRWLVARGADPPTPGSP